MTTKWEINRALRASDLPAPSRLIMFVLSDIAEAGTAEVPERHTPSLSVLAAETGLGEATVKRHLDLLELAGWVKRDRPTIENARRYGERTRYSLTLPEVGSESQVLGSEEAQEVETWAQSEPTQGSERAQAGLRVSPIDKEHDPNDQYDLFGGHASTTAAEQPPKKQRGKSPRTTVPLDFTVTDDTRRWASEHGITVDLAQAAIEFVNYWVNATKNTEKADWGRAFQNWLIKAQQFTAERLARASPNERDLASYHEIYDPRKHR